MRTQLLVTLESLAFFDSKFATVNAASAKIAKVEVITVVVFSEHLQRHLQKRLTRILKLGTSKQQRIPFKQQDDPDN
jgi:hypothetical protein